MRTLIAILVLAVFGGALNAQEMPGTTNVQLVKDLPVTLKDEIAFEKEKLVSYSDAAKASKGNRLPLVALVGCYVDDIQLFLQLKGKVILCYLPSKAAPFTTVESGVVVGLWNADGSTCVRHDVAAFTFSDPKFRDSLLFNKKTDEPTTKVLTLEEFNQLYGANGNITGYTCTNGKCVPTYAPTKTGPFGRPK